MNVIVCVYCAVLSMTLFKIYSVVVCECAYGLIPLDRLNETFYPLGDSMRPAIGLHLDGQLADFLQAFIVSRSDSFKPEMASKREMISLKIGYKYRL